MISFVAYERSLLLVFVGYGFLLIKSRELPLPKPRNGKDWTSTYELKKLQSFWSRVPLAIIYVMFNFAILIIPLIPPYQNADGSPRKILGWYYNVRLSTIVLFGIVYYFAIHNSRWSILSLGGVQPDVVTQPRHNETYGNRREMRTTTVSPLLLIGCRPRLAVSHQLTLF